jgi:hypothetical protein
VHALGAACVACVGVIESTHVVANSLRMVECAGPFGNTKVENREVMEKYVLEAVDVRRKRF